MIFDESVGTLDGFLVLSQPTLAARVCDGLGNAGFSSLRDIDLQRLGLGKQVLNQLNKQAGPYAPTAVMSWPEPAPLPALFPEY